MLCYVITGTADGLLPLQRVNRIRVRLRARCGLPIVHTLADLRDALGALRARVQAGEFATRRYCLVKRPVAGTFYVPHDPIVEATVDDCIALGLAGGGFVTRPALQEIADATFYGAADEPDDV
jgi:hypothetical protein